MTNLTEAKSTLDSILRKEEGERLKPYLCTAGRATIGVGATTYADGRKVSMLDPPISRAQMDRMLELAIDGYIQKVMAMVDQKCTTNQLVGLVLCGYNIGLEGLKGSTIIKRHLAGDYVSAARAFGLWDKFRPTPDSPLQVSPALAARRLREAAIYATPDDHDAAPEPIPQEVAPESSMAKSPINISSVVAGGTAAVVAATQTLGVVKDFKESLAGLGEWMVPLLCVVIVACAGYAIYQRVWKQRAGGWA